MVYRSKPIIKLYQISTCFTYPHPSSRYSETVSEILVSLRKTEDSLAMLKRGRKSAQAATTAPTFTDEDRIRAQLKLDVSELATKVREIGDISK